MKEEEGSFEEEDRQFVEGSNYLGKGLSKAEHNAKAKLFSLKYGGSRVFISRKWN